MATATATVDTAQEWVPDIGFGDRLRIVRRKKHRTQEGMAALLDVKKVTYASWEAGAATPSYEDVVTIARRLYLLDRVPQWWTLGADDPTHGSGASSLDVSHYGSEGWGFESLRAHPARFPHKRRRDDRRRQRSVVPLYLVRDTAVPA